VSIQVGAVIRSRYLLVSVLGRGGMGEVFGARDLREGGEVAIKVVRRTMVDDTMMARLEREAVAARRIESPFVPKVFEIDRTEEGELFLVMERLDGEALSQRLRDRGALTWDEVRALVDDVLQGLCHAHAAGVVHRDLKPGNIFLERPEDPTSPGGVAAIALASRERAMVLDFGVCKIDAHDEQRLTTTGEAVGTIAYMAPEQIRGASKVDGRADLYALSALAFEALTGELPHDGQGQMAIIASKLERSARSLRDLAKVPVPPGLEAFLAKGLARKPEGRFSSAEDMLRAWRALGQPTVMPRMPGSGAVHNPPTETGVTAGTMALRGGSRVGLVLAALGLFAASVVLVLALRKRSEDPTPPATGVGVSVGTSVSVGPSASVVSSVDVGPSVAATATEEPMLEIGVDAPDAGTKPKAGRGTNVGPKHTATTPTTKSTTPAISTRPRY
jgi:serine/threonine-protein kinase